MHGLLALAARISSLLDRKHRCTRRGMADVIEKEGDAAKSLAVRNPVAYNCASTGDN